MIDLSKLVTLEQQIVQARSAKNLEINAWRLAKNKTTFTYAGKLIACDDLSRGDIDAANNEIANLGALPVGWLGGWKAVDNSYVVIGSVATWKLFYSAMFNQGNANFAAAQAYKTQLAAATTLRQIKDIVLI
jgi:hypothetical protein